MGKQSSPNNPNSSNPQCPKITQPITKPKSPPKLSISQPPPHQNKFTFNFPDKNLMVEQSIDQNQNNLQNQQNSSYELEKGLSIEVKALQKHFQFNSSQEQLLPFMVSIKTLTSVSDMAVENDFLQNRPSLDLICVIDNSGSMSGEKIKNVQFTLLQLLDMLNDKDRLSLILFNSSATLLCHLIRVDQTNKTKIQNLIRNIQAGGGTDIASGMNIALQMIKDRKQKNQVSSVFLLSDGQDNGADQRIKQKLNLNNQQLLNDPFTIHSFGYGTDHNGLLMNNISDLKDGNFYYIQNINQIDEFFVDALGGLFSVVAQDVLIDVIINRTDEHFKKFFSNSIVFQTYGDMWKTVQANKHYQIKINQLYSGISKDFIFVMKFPKQNLASIEDYERNVEIIAAKVSAKPVKENNTQLCIKNSTLTLTLFNEKEQVAEDSEVDDSVELNYLRVNAANAIQNAIKQSQNQQFQQAQVILTDALKKLEKSHPANQEKLNYLKEEIQTCQKNAQPQIYQAYGQQQMQCAQGWVMQQKSQPNQPQNQSAPQQQMYQTLKQQKCNYQGGPQLQQPPPLPISHQQNPMNPNLSQLQQQQVINKSNIYQQSVNSQQQPQYPQSQQLQKQHPNLQLQQSMKPQNLQSGQTMMTQSQQIPQLGVKQTPQIQKPGQIKFPQQPTQQQNVPQQPYSQQQQQQQQQKPHFQQSPKQLNLSQIQNPQQ